MLVQVQIGQPGTRAVLSALSPGNAVITATVGSIRDSIAVTVRTPGPVDRILLPYVPELSPGATYQMAWILMDADRVVLPTQAPSFTIDGASVLAVSASGLLTPIGEGIATVTATLNGKVATTSITVLAADHAFVWSDLTGMTDLGVPVDYVSSRALAISQSGRIAGTASTFGGASIRAVVRTAGSAASVRVLRTLVDGSRSEAFGVNSAGVVVGYATPPGGKRHAMLWNASGDVQDLGTLPGGSESVALGINNAGQVVGWSGNQ